MKRALTPADELKFIKKAYSDNPCASLHSFQAGYFHRHRRLGTSLVIELDTLRRPLLQAFADFFMFKWLTAPSNAKTLALLAPNH